MKQPPPPYYQVALASDQVVSNLNENQAVQSQAVTHLVIPTIVENTNVEFEHDVPPAYDEASQSENHTSTSATAGTDGAAPSSIEPNHPPLDRPQNQA